MNTFKTLRRLALAFAACASLAACNSNKEIVIEASVPAKLIDGTIVLETPEREPGQESALGLKCDPIDTVRIGFVGIGMRGEDAVRRYTYIEGVKIAAVCDLLPERAAAANEYLLSRGFPAAKEYSGEEGYKQLCESDDIDLVYICTPWKLHTPVAVYAMEHGKHVAVEVPSATSIDECWQLVNTCEKTRKHCMILENCCYDFYELTALNMAQQGLFGEIYHAEGAYIHNLDPYWDEYQGNWRLEFNQSHAGDNYPTHGFGPVCQVMNIHRGDKMDYLVAMDTKSIHGASVAKEKMGVDEFANGEHTVTLVRTEKGHQIEVQHNVYGARPYSRLYSLTGTEGYASKYPTPSFSLAPNPEVALSVEEYEAACEKYKSPITIEYEEKAKEVGGHGGMDFIMDSRLIYCLRNGLPLDIDVYDTAEWSSLTELSRISILNGSKPVKVPDFTRGDCYKTDGFKYAMK